MKNIFFLVEKDLRLLLRSPAFYLLLLVSSFVTGNSFILAVDLYSKASSAALNDPFYAKSFEPVPGVFVPTMGGYYLLFSLIFPFVVIPLLARERENNTLSVLYQLGFSSWWIIISKIFIAVTVILTSFLVMGPCLISWKMWGGYVPVMEMALLIAGYFLYGIVVSGVSLFAASISRNTAGAAIITLGVVLFSWIVDFTGATMSSHLIEILSKFSLSSFISVFEKGILSAGIIIEMLFVSAFLLVIAVLFISSGMGVRRKISTFVIFTTLLVPILRIDTGEKDITESHRNSFPSQIAENLKKIEGIKINVYLSTEDSRYRDFKSEFVDRLKLIRRDAKIELKKGKDLKDRYGLIEYEVKINGKWVKDSTYSNSTEEAFLILSRLSGINFDLQENPYPGYPLTIDKNRLKPLKILYFLVLPIVFSSLLIWTRVRE